MISNVRLREAAEKPESISLDEIKQLIQEVIQNRKFIRQEIALFKLRND